MTDMPKLSRRMFLVGSAVAGGGLLLGFHLPTRIAEALADTVSEGREINAWIVVQPDDTVIIRVARSEMGQGIFTSLPMLVAEELECDWSKVRAEYASAAENLRRNHVYVTMSTGGSRSVRSSHEFLRTAGASAREMLIAAAAQRWNVAASECRAADSMITHQPTGRTLTFGSVADAASRLAPPEHVALKPESEWKLIGKPVKRLDIADKVMAKPVFGIDVRLPGMVYATVANCPVFGGKLKSYDDSAIRSRKGVRQVVPLGDAVAVVGDGYWQAKRALDALPVTWDFGPNAAVSTADIAKYVRDGLTASNVPMARNDGDVQAALANAHLRVEAEYYAPFLSHATMEPMNCTAHVTAEKVEVWAPTQNAEASLAAAAQAAGVDPRKVEVHTTFLGGGFGRRGAFQDFVRQAVAISKAVGKPVKLVWSREEDIQHDFYRPVAAAKFSAGLDASGRLVAWSTRIAGQSILSTVRPAMVKNGMDASFLEGIVDMPYDVANLRVDYSMRNTHVPVGFWRSVNHSQNAFFKESFVDEMAHASGQDPYQFRRAMLGKSPKHLAVLDAVAKKADWDAKLPPGMFRGMALNEAYGSIVAEVAEISIGLKGEVTLHRVVAAIDSGHVVNPATIEAQVESAIVYGLTAALYGEITIKDGRVMQHNFDDYRMLRIDGMPKVEVAIVPSGGFWGGVGEPGLPPLAPAMSNAIFSATGKRIRALPLKNQDLSST